MFLFRFNNNILSNRIRERIAMNETSYCPNCGAEDNDGNIFCGSCGINMKEGMKPPQPTQTISTTPYTTPQEQNIPPQQTTQRMYSTKFVPKPQANTPTTQGTFGLILSIITFFGLSWISWIIRIDRAYIVVIFFVIGITAIIMSGRSIKNHKTRGTVGLILGILGTLPILGALFIIVIYHLLMAVTMI